MAMAFSSVSVVTSSLLLKRFQPSCAPHRALPLTAATGQHSHKPLAEAMRA